MELSNQIKLLLMELSNQIALILIAQSGTLKVRFASSSSRNRGDARNGTWTCITACCLCLFFLFEYIRLLNSTYPSTLRLVASSSPLLVCSSCVVVCCFVPEVFLFWIVWLWTNKMWRYKCIRRTVSKWRWWFSHLISWPETRNRGLHNFTE